MKVTHTSVQARKILLAFLTIVLLITIAAIVLRNAISQKLDNISKLSVGNNHNTELPEKTLLLLQQADNDFQAFLVNRDKQKKHDYEAKLSTAFNNINILLKQKITTDGLYSHSELKNWFRQKVVLSGELVQLKQGFDSLVTNYSDVTPEVTLAPVPVMAIVTHKDTIKTVKAHSDTIVAHTVKKTGLFTRLKAAILNKQPAAISTTVINHNSDMGQINTNAVAQKIVTQNNNAYNAKLKQLQTQNNKILNTQRGLILFNSHMISELDGIISTIKDINFSMATDFKEKALRSYRESANQLNLLYLVALVLVIVFSGLIILFILQLNRSELKLRREIETSVALAQQKTDLLYHMSHEIRNPLTAIKGALYSINRKLPLSKQKEMLDSITLSSDMMLTTLNDTLDAAKMETNELKIHTEPFTPYFEIQQVIDSMAFSARSKKLYLEYNFNGNKAAVLEGDGFRLKQILINLLSNAIKYTLSGGVTVNATLADGDGTLRVDVTDTGLGISEDQQNNLFSKYYQTNSSKGQLGTGLGLFICKQLIKLQDGKISVKSNVGAGVTFTFSIPYKLAPVKLKDKPVVDLELKLAGKSILAVDDNPLNLLLLKKLMQKWQLSFHEASSGKEALEILSKNNIDIIFTDLIMPGMSGEKLISAIKKLLSPMNQIPVIIMSGDDGLNEDKIAAMGCCGKITKPFIQSELLEQLTDALKYN
jgi:signal transduction histidine kinase